MKVMITIFVYFFIIPVLFGQKVDAIPIPPPPPPLPEEVSCVRICEEMPRFPGCEDLLTTAEKKTCADKKMLEFIYSNFKYPTENYIEGSVIVAFVIERDGSLSNAKIIRGLCEVYNLEALRVVRMMPDFIPGKQNGRMVRTQFNLPIRVRLE